MRQESGDRNWQTEIGRLQQLGDRRNWGKRTWETAGVGGQEELGKEDLGDCRGWGTGGTGEKRTWETAGVGGQEELGKEDLGDCRGWGTGGTGEKRNWRTEGFGSKDESREEFCDNTKCRTRRIGGQEELRMIRGTMCWGTGGIGQRKELKKERGKLQDTWTAGPGQFEKGNQLGSIPVAGRGSIEGRINRKGRWTSYKLCTTTSFGVVEIAIANTTCGYSL